MNVDQICASCKSVYQIPAGKQMAIVWCPSCGHPNKQQPPQQHKSQTVRKAEIYIDMKGNRTEPSIPTSSKRNRSAIRYPTTSTNTTLETLRQKIENYGRVFILGCAPSLTAYDLEFLIAEGWPTIGVNHSYKVCNRMDALVMADYGFIVTQLNGIHTWQKQYPGRLIFWMRKTKVRGHELQWCTTSGKHGRCIDVQSQETTSDYALPFNESKVYYFDKVPRAPMMDLEIPIKLNFQHSVIFPAINLAFLLGAKEIYLLGVELDSNAHFYDPGDTKNFPKAESIKQRLVEQVGMYEEQGVSIYTCAETGTLAKKIPHRSFDVAISYDQPYFVKALKERIQQQGKVFLLGAGPSLEKLPMQHLCGWPVVGTNSAFMKYPAMDCLIFGDKDFIIQYKEVIKVWQRWRQEKPILYWHRSSTNTPGFTRICNWEHAPKGPAIWDNHNDELSPKLAIKHSIVTCAINLCYFLGAREIYLLGIDLNDNTHFWDLEAKIASQINKPTEKFPGAKKIVEFIARQWRFLQDRGVQMYNCSPESALKKHIPFKPLIEAADPHRLNKLYEGLLP